MPTATVEKLIKSGRFAHSGCYVYSAREAQAMGLPFPPPPEIGVKDSYVVYRPAPVLVDAVAQGLFTRMTLTREHPEGWVEPANWKEEAIGWTGDSADVEYLKETGEVSVNGSMTLTDAVAIAAYDAGVRELSPGYSANFQWKRGSHRGQAFDAVMTEVVETNHLAMVDSGRGGKWSAITDAAGKVAASARKIASGLWWAVKRRSLVRDEATVDEAASQATGFYSGLEHLASARATMPESEIENRVEQLRSLVIDLPYGDEKSLLMQYLDDLKLMKLYPDETVRSAINLACSLFDKLDRTAMGQAALALGDAKGETMFNLSDLLGGKKKGKTKDAADMCDACDGTGSKDGKACDMCDGTGKKKVADVIPEESAGIDPKGILEPAQGSPQAPTTPSAPPASVGAESVKTVGAAKVEATPSKVEGVTDEGKAKDEPDPDEPPAEVPGATTAAQPDPSGAAPAAAAPAAPAAQAAPAGPAAPAKSPADVLGDEVTAAVKKFIDATSGGGAAPAAPAQPAAPAPPAAPAKEDAAPDPAAPAQAPAPAAAPPEEGGEEKKKVGDSADDSASSLTALIGSSGQVADGAPDGLEGLLGSTRGKGR